MKNVLDEGADKESVSRRRVSSYRENTLHRQYARGTEEIRAPQTWDWLKRVKTRPFELITSRIRLTNKMFHRCVTYVVKGWKLSAIYQQNVRN